MSEPKAPVVVDLTALCPKCGQGNQCAVASGGDASDCWCMNVAVDARVLEDVRFENRCICAQCAQKS